MPKNQLSVPGSFLNQFVTDHFEILDAEISIYAILTMIIYLYYENSMNVYNVYNIYRVFIVKIDDHC